MGRVLHPDDVVAGIAGRQRGLITREQLIAAGIGRGGIERRIAAGRLHRIFRGVYLVGHAAAPELAIELAATLACGHGSTLSHRSGIDLWRLLPRAKRPEKVDVSIVGRRGLVLPGITIHRPRHLDRRDVTRVQDIPVTTPARTLLDFAEVAGRRELERAWSEAQARNLITRRKIHDLLERSHGRRGAPRLCELLQRAAGPQLSRSELEELMLHLIRQAHLPEPEMNILLLSRYRVDFLWREYRLVVETDGAGWHASGQRRTSDHRRDSDLRDAGYKVERFTDHELTYEPHAAVARLTRAIYG